MRGVAVVPVRNEQMVVGGPEALAEAADLADELTVVVIGPHSDSVAASLATHPEFALRDVTVVAARADSFHAASWADALRAIAEPADVVIVGGSADGRDVAVHLAAQLDRPLVAGAMRVRPPLVTVWSHGGVLQRDVEVSGPFVAAIEPGVRTSPFGHHDTGAEPGTASGRLSVIDVATPPSSDRGVVVVGEDDADPATVDLAEADRLVGVGAGLMAPDHERSMAAITAIAEALGASVGATRVVTDAGLYGHDRQIGTTGVVVDPRLYLAFAISGAVQHTAGLGSPDHVVSVNLDPHCPMMDMADLAITSDANAVVEHLAEALGATT